MADAREPVILVHGLWMTGLEFGVLRQRLQTGHGFDVHVFSYPSMHGNVDEIVAELAEFAHQLAAGTGRVHVVGHSLGGAIAFRALEQGMRDLPGNAVLLGSPLNGSRAASGVGRLSMLRPLIGPHALSELAEPCGRCWHWRLRARARRHRRNAASGHRPVLRALRRRKRRHRRGERNRDPRPQRPRRGAAQSRRDAVRERRRRTGGAFPAAWALRARDGQSGQGGRSVRAPVAGLVRASGNADTLARTRPATGA